MRMKSLLVAAAAAIGCSAFATNFTWTGGGNDGGLWNNPANWGQASNYPQTASDAAIFTNNATAVLNTGATTIGNVKVTAGTVTIEATDGSTLNCAKDAAASGSGLTVSKGATLIMKAPMSLNKRFDKWEAGTMIIRDTTVTMANASPWYVALGTNIFDGTASLSFPNANLMCGNENTRSLYLPVFFRDSANISVKGLGTSASTAEAPSVEYIQEGTDTVVTVGANGIGLTARTTDIQRYTLKSGTLSATTITASASPPSGKTYLQSPTNLWYVQEGGTSTFAKVALANGSAALRGGVMNFTGANTDFTMGSGTTFEISGGTLGWPRTFNPSGWQQFRFSGRFGVTVPSGLEFQWDWSRAHVAPDTVFVHDGEGTLKFIRAISTEGVGLEIGAGKTVTVDSNCTISAPRGSTEPWKLTLNNGSTLDMNTGTARLSLPLDLTVNGTGKLSFRNCRSAAVAHKLTVDGVEKAKGRYYINKGHSFVEGSYSGSSLIVPHIWTGAGGDNLWSNPANWDGNTVPNGTTMCADISRASEAITLNEDITLSCLVAMPNGAERKVTVTGSGSISFEDSNNLGYDCALLVPQGCELVLDVDLKRTSANTMALQGGGLLTVRKDYPGCTSGYQPLLAIDGNVSFAGTTVIESYNTTYHFFTAWTYDAGESHLFIEDGATVTAGRFQVTKNGYTMPDDFRQRGGTTTYGAFYLGNYNNGSTARGTLVYYLDGGTMTVNGAINLGRCLGGSDTNRYPGGSFEMSGGTLTCNGMNGGMNQNFVRLYGGDLYLKGSLDASFDRPDKISVSNRNDITYYLGGVTIHPTGAERNLSSGNAWLTGKNGDCTIDASSYNFNFASGNTIAGPGGLTVVGASSRQVKVSCTLNFTGPITVKSGEFICYYASTVNGPCAVIVESADGKATFGHGIDNELDRIVLVQDSNLFVSSGQRITTKRLVVNGVDLPADTYNARFGDGTVIVTGSAPASWLNGTVGDLSWNAADTTTTVDSATTLSSLTYNPVGTDATNTLAGAGVFTFEDGANIHVAKGDTLVIDNNVVLGGKVTKTGEGEVVFNGAVTCSGTPAVDNDTCWLTVQEGGATFDGAVTGVRLVTCGTKTLPVITLNEHCTVTDYAVVLTAYSYGSAEKGVLGETRQNGATVDYSDGVFESLRASTAAGKDAYPLSNPWGGGAGRYVLNAGTFKTSGAYKLSFIETSGTLGTFEFVQNGGTFLVMKNFMFARNISSILKCTYTINGGHAEINGTFDGTVRTCNFINFNGGTVVFKISGQNFAERQYFTVTVGGDVVFETGTAAQNVRFPNDWTGDGTITFSLGNFFFSGGLNVGGLNITNAAVTLGANTALAAAGETSLSMARTGATLNLDYDGQMPFKTLKVADRNRSAGVYSAEVGPNSVRDVLAGDGELLILEGSEPGIVISIR